MAGKQVESKSSEDKEREDYLDQSRRYFTVTPISEIENTRWQIVFCSMLDCMKLDAVYNKGETKPVWEDRGVCNHWGIMLLPRSINIDIANKFSMRSPRFPVCFSYRRRTVKPDWISDKEWYYATRYREGNVEVKTK